VAQIFVRRRHPVRRPALNSIKLGGYPLGFWFAQQGSIYIFIALIFYYAKKMGDIDRQVRRSRRIRGHTWIFKQHLSGGRRVVRAVHRHRHLGACR
jgi:hypothetical protein